MRIFGIGTDIVSIGRIEKNLNKYGDRFAAKILQEAELKEFMQKKYQAVFLAKRFAAKEAVVKAMGTGFRDGLVLRNIAVGHDDLGKPILEYSGCAKAFIENNAITNSYISLSDEKENALAFVTLVCE